MQDTMIKKAGAGIWRARLTQPFRTALGQHDILENVLFSVELKDGLRGFGEAAVATHITGETVQETLARLKECAAAIEGCDISGYRAVSGRLSEKLSKNPCALAAAEMAVLDALTRQKKIPFWKLFGGRPRLLKTDMTIVIGTAAEASASAARLYRKGFRAFKVKIGRDMDLDVKRVIGVAKAAPGADLYLDANQGYTAAEILKFLNELKCFKIKPALVEQPVPRGDWEGLREVTRKGKVLVCADESVRSLEDAARIARGGYAGALNIKLMKFGIFSAGRIVVLARRAGLKLMIGEMMETPLAATAAAHFAAGWGGFDYVDLDTPFFIDEKVTKGRWWNERGVYDLRRVKAGIGVVPVLK